MTIRRFFLLLILTVFGVSTYLAGKALKEVREFQQACVQAGGKPAVENRTGKRACMAGMVVIPVSRD